jgi:hypothetical protein
MSMAFMEHSGARRLSIGAVVRQHQEEKMLKASAIGLSFAIGFSTVASAAIPPAPIETDDQGVVQVAEHCGPGWYRYGPDRRCHKFHTRFGTNRGTVDACPPAMHIGPEGVYCWPN